MLERGFLKQIQAYSRGVYASFKEHFSRSLLKSAPSEINPSKSVTRYQEWSSRWDTPSEDERLAMSQFVDDNELKTIIILIPGEIRSMKRTLSSLSACSYRNWDLFIPTKRCTKTEREQIRALCSRYSSYWSETDQLTKDYAGCVILQPGVVLRTHALCTALIALSRADADQWLFYSDEDRASRKRGIHSPLFKPSPQAGLNQATSLLGSFVLLRLENRRAKLLMHQFMNTATSRRSLNSFVPKDIGSHELHRISHVLYHDNTRNKSIDRRLVVRSADLAKSDSLETSIIIISDNYSINQIHKTIEAILCQEGVTLNEIIIVSASVPSAVVSQLQRFESTGARIALLSSHQIPWADQANLALKHSHADICVILSAGTTLSDRSLLYRLIGEASADHAGVVSVHHDHDLAWMMNYSCQYQFRNSTADVDMKRTLRDLNRLSWSLDFVAGDIFALKKSIWQVFHGFPEAKSREYCQIRMSIDCLSLHLKNRSCAVLTPTDGLRSCCRRVSQDILNLLESEAYLIARNGSKSRLSRAISPSSPCQIAIVPQQSSVWITSQASRSLTIIIFSCVLSQGYGVALVVQIHARYLRRLGYNIIIAGPSCRDELLFKGCSRRIITTENEAAALVVETNPVVAICHTPPFYTIACLLGQQYLIMAIDHGEPPPYLFSNYREREAIQRVKSTAMKNMSRVYAISNAVADEASWHVDGIIELGNTHIKQWRDEMHTSRLHTRQVFDWNHKWIILTVCRIQHRERSYKGFEHLYELRQWMQLLQNEGDLPLVFVVCGRGTQHDEDALKCQGFTVFRNVNDEQLEELYAAADIYVSQSQWEGFNLGIAQALAMGLDVYASDIAAHRQFSISVSNDIRHTAETMLATLRSHQQRRSPKRLSWRKGLKSLATAIDGLTTLRDQTRASHSPLEQNR
ncbi:MAG: glycosyltransferase family 4 protein [Cyanobacteriota bacterium]|nr:glycosyltransferase family 4 protein [Cyanobacteriota bacterium]